MNPIFLLEIRTSNDAFWPDPLTELARLLRAVAQRMESGEQEGVIRDLNGNSVGHFSAGR